MRRVGFIVLVLVLSFYMTGCGKKEASLDEAQAPMTMETVSTIPAMPEVKVAETKTPEAAMQVQSQEAIRPELLPQATKPTALEIQTALLNAGFDPGKIDGKIGSTTKKAISDFQKAKGLKVDGRVGPQTWAVLSTYLNASAGTKAKKKKR